MYTANTPVKRAIWKNHEIIGYVTISLKDADKINELQHELFLGFTAEEHKLIQDGTEKELIAAGIIEEE